MTTACLDDRILFCISNPGVLSESEKSLIFKSSFSTKGAGRGFGLYRAKLITRRYLEGDLTVREQDKTIFFELSLPAAGILRSG